MFHPPLSFCSVACRCFLWCSKQYYFILALVDTSTCLFQCCSQAFLLSLYISVLFCYLRQICYHLLSHIPWYCYSIFHWESLRCYLHLRILMCIEFFLAPFIYFCAPFFLQVSGEYVDHCVFTVLLSTACALNCFSIESSFAVVCKCYSLSKLNAC